MMDEIVNGEPIFINIPANDLAWKVQQDFQFSMLIDTLLIDTNSKIYQFNHLPKLISNGRKVTEFKPFIRVTMFNDNDITEDLISLFSTDNNAETGEEYLKKIYTVFINRILHDNGITLSNLVSDNQYLSVKTEAGAKILVEDTKQQIDHIFELLNDDLEAVERSLIWCYNELGILIHRFSSSYENFDMMLDDFCVKRSRYATTYMFPNGISLK